MGHNRSLARQAKLIVGKLDVLNVKCGRRGRYRLSRLIARYGVDAKLFDWSDESRPTARESTRETCMTSAAHGAPIYQRWYNLVTHRPADGVLERTFRR
jgi:hypothetical protein